MKSTLQLIEDFHAGVDLLADAAADMETAPDADANAQIEYIVRELTTIEGDMVVKAKNFAGFVAATEARAAEYKEIATQASKRAGALTNFVKRVKENMVYAIGEWAKITGGEKKLGTAGAILRVQKNGGKDPLEYDDVKVPYKYKLYTCKMSYAEYMRMKAAGIMPYSEETETDTTSLRTALEAGEIVEGARLLSAGEHFLRIVE